MAIVISSDTVSKHDVDKYNFKVLSSGRDFTQEKVEVVETPAYSRDNHPGQRVCDVDSSALSKSSKDALIESLMKKTDDMSSNFIKLQMKLEAKEEEYALEIQKAKESAFAEGLESGKEQALSDSKDTLESSMTQFTSSISKLESSAKEFEVALEGIKKSLIDAALDIAKEVINVELNSNSNAIAQVLSSELIKELQSASKVTLKVNPKDHGAISEHVGSLEHIEVLSDSAVSQGGVIAISDAGNIDAEISKRFERVKRAALSE
jgi:flagellar assembly protein FliH